MVVTALALRLLVMGFVYKIQLDRSKTTDLRMNREVARSIVTGGGFSSPFPDPSGPTAHLPPAYAYLLAASSNCLDLYNGLGLAILTLNNLSPP